MKNSKLILFTLLFLTTLSADSHPETFRWKDIAANTYAQSYQDSYDYAVANFGFSYDPASSSTLRAHLSATNLKPNFAYQVKLTGKPTALWGEAGDDTTNERLGYLGRWWRHQPNPGNSNDADYEANHHDPEYIFEGYLVFSFFVSDSTGRVEEDFVIDSSYHVLWWEHQRVRGSCDSPVIWSTVVGLASNPAYEENVGPTSVGVFAEIERNCTGTTSMPAGLYNCCLVLTEESFHQTGEDEGNWQSVLVDDNIQFEIGGVNEVQDGKVPSRTTLLGAVPNPFNPSTTLSYEMAYTGHVRLKVYDPAGRLVAALVDEHHDAGNHQVKWDGRDSSGRMSSSGVYLYRLETNNFVETKRMTLVK